MKENSDLGLSARAWDAAKTYTSSNFVKRHDGAIDQDSIETLSNFCKEHGIETFGMDMDTKADDRLLKYTIKKVVPIKHLDEIENHMETYLISDEKGHDIGTYTITENGPVFKLSPKIVQGNKAIMDRVYPNEASQERAILEEKYSVESLETLVEKLSKNEKLTLANEQSAKQDVKEAFEKRQMSFPTEEENSEALEEQEAIDKLPADMRGQVLEQCRKEGVRIKEVLVVDCPKCVAREMDNGENHIRENGGPIIMIKAVNGSLSGKDDLYMFQDGQKLPDVERNQDRMVELMDQHKDEGAVPELEDTREDEIMKQLDEAMLEYEEKMEEIERTDYPSKAARDEAINDAREDLKDDAREVLGDYVPDQDGTVANYVKAIEYEATPDSMEEIDEIQANINDGIINTAKSAGTIAKGVAIGALGVGIASTAVNAMDVLTNDNSNLNEDIEENQQGGTGSTPIEEEETPDFYNHGSNHEEPNIWEQKRYPNN